MESNQIQSIVSKQRKFFSKGNTKSLTFRLEQLNKLKSLVQHYEEKLTQAVKEDLGKPPFETFTGEIGFLIEEINFVLKNLKNWQKPQKVPTPLVFRPAKSYIYSEPYGIVLIISPWNYPYLLSLSPLIGAIAAGNCAILKPSEVSPKASHVISEMLSQGFEESFIAIVEGGISESQKLLEQKFDYIFFTGGEFVGKIVMEAASKNLTPVTLELGGKSPCIVDDDIDIDITAKRITWGKFFNAGQSCVGPDYLLVSPKNKDLLLKKIKESIQDFFGLDPSQSPDYGRIINQKHFNRIKNLLKDTNIYYGGNFNEKNCYIAPTILHPVTSSEQIMKEEIFGPILPILEYQNLDEAFLFIQKRPKPLAAYLFSTDSQNQERFLNEISFGGGCINDALSHYVNYHFPLGGVGASGMGGYHGKFSFETFTHRKTIMKKPLWIDIPFRYPPYKNKLKFLKKFYGK